MKALLLREITSFFGSSIGYLVIGLFLLINGLFLWVFESDFNILNSGYADMTPFFTFTPWIFIFLIPAVTMRSFSDEKKQGTLELLLTKPLSVWQIVLGKFLGVFCLIIIALLPTLIYINVLSFYGNPSNNLDIGSIIGSYIGLLFLASSYLSIGIFTSSLSKNQITAFIFSAFICFFFYFGCSSIASFLNLSFLTKLGIDFHFNSICRGVIDTRDSIYFISITILFLAATVFQLKITKG